MAEQPDTTPDKPQPDTAPAAEAASIEEAAPAECFPIELTGKIISATSGDTFTLLTNSKPTLVRVLGIDAPEPGQPYSDRSRRVFTVRFVGKQAEVTIRLRDPSGIGVGEVKLGTQDVGPLMLRAGMAWHVKKENDSSIYSKSEEAARRAKRGLWHDEGAVAPWIWRDKSATPASETATPDAPGIAVVPQAVADQPPQPAAGQYWLNTRSNVRHNRSCEYYNNTSQGRFCTKKEGRPCGYCGG